KILDGFRRPRMPTYRLLIEYDGSRFHGWQIQRGDLTVQEALESALFVACRERTAVIGSGRTDAGVHARGQVAHVHLQDRVNVHRLRRVLNCIFCDGVVVLSVYEADDVFHARYVAIERRYLYYVVTESRVLDVQMRWRVMLAPDFDAMNHEAAQLLGTYDF